MKHLRKVMTLVVAALMALVVATPAWADGTGSITITPPDGVDAAATNTYKIYKVFDADGDGTNISYKRVSGKTTVPAGFEVDTAGNVVYTANKGKKAGDEGFVSELSATDIAAIASYVTEADLVATVTTTGTANAVAQNLPNGFYYITTSTGTVVTIDSTNKDAEVIDKNTVPGLDKKITNTDKTAAGMAGTIDADGKKALAELGKDVEYTATITVGKGCKGYEFHDKMGTGLTFKGNESVTVTANPAVTGITGDWYTIKETPDTGDTLTITFADGIAENTKITIKYIGTVNSDALTVETGKNTARVDYGDENSNNHTPDSETNVYNAKFTVTKKDGNNAPLAGAGFVVKNADNKYYRYSANGEAATEAQGTEGEEGYVPAKAAVPKGVSWVDSIDDATENFSDNTGAVPSFTGLVDGTYTLIEKTVPSGYNKAADSTFTIAASNYESSNLVQTAEVINNSGTELPSTGGMGTTILYVVGGVMIAGAAVYLLTKKRASSMQ